MLIRNNALNTIGFFINFDSFLAYIQSWNVDIYISIKHLLYFFKCKVIVNTIIVILSISETLILYKQILLPDFQKIFFYSVLQPKFTLYTYFVNYMIYKILEQNNTNYFIQISHNYKFDYITKLVYKNCFAERMKVDAAIYLLLAWLLFYKRNGIIILLVDKNIKTKPFKNIKFFSNNITV